MNDRDFVRKLKTIGFNGLASKAGHKATHKDVMALNTNGGDSELYKIAKDKVLFNHITRGNQNDKTVKRDVEAISRDHASSKDWRPKAKAEIERRKEIHRAKWGKDSIQ